MLDISYLVLTFVFGLMLELVLSLSLNSPGRLLPYQSDKHFPFKGL